MLHPKLRYPTSIPTSTPTSTPTSIPTATVREARQENGDNITYPHIGTVRYPFTCFVSHIERVAVRNVSCFYKKILFIFE